MDVKKRITVSISTWFCIPEQGMKDMEILCRSSAFAVKSRSKDFPHKMHFITSSHNIAPWKYPKKHPEEWLQYINERHTYYTIETRNPDGSFMTQSEMLPCSYHHNSRDLAVLHLETDHDELFETFSLEPHKLSGRELMAGDSILFNGYSVVDSTGNHSSENSSGFSPADNAPSSELDVRRTVPTIVPATFVSQSMFLNYARANHILNGCMSGGPVTCKPTVEAKRKEGRSAANASVSERSEVCGMFENVVPDDCEDQELRGLVSFVGTETIAGSVPVYFCNLLWLYYSAEI
jgi:hypothetical protein